MLFYLAILLLSAQCLAQNHGNHGNGHNTATAPGSGEVDSAIVDLNHHYNDNLCLELLLVDCSTHVTQGDETVCGSNGITYDNHCHFTHAMCEFLHTDDIDLQLTNHGPCKTTTTAPMTTKPPTVATKTTTSGSMTSASGSVTTTTDSSPMTSTTDVTTTTTGSVNSVIQNVFCQNLAAISCAGSFQIVCGTDGQLYPNQCELSKAKCKDPTLTISPDESSCVLVGRR